MKSSIPRYIDQDPRKTRVVLDDEQYGIALLDRAAIVLNRFDGALGRCGGNKLGLERLQSTRAIDWPGAARRTGIMQRQIDREGAAHVGRAAKLDLTAEKVRQLSADGQPKSGAAIFAAGAGVGLLEGLEDDLLFLGAIPMPESDTSKAMTWDA